MTAYEQSMLELVKRVEVLESRAHGVMDRLREFDGYVERLEALETEQSKAISSAAMLCAQHYVERQQAAELKRQDRWHASYNAAWPALAQKYETWQLIYSEKHDEAHDAIVDSRLEWLHLAATNIANRAHGPLTP